MDNATSATSGLGLAIVIARLVGLLVLILFPPLGKGMDLTFGQTSVTNERSVRLDARLSWRRRKQCDPFVLGGLETCGNDTRHL
jgi:hypothetical protein